MSKQNRNGAMRSRALGAGLALAAAVATVIPSDAHAEGYTFKQIARQGDKAPLAQGGHFEYEMTTKALDAQGGVTFEATLTTGGRGLFTARDGQVSTADRGAVEVDGAAKASMNEAMLAALRPGMVMPGGAVLRNAASMVTNARGQMAFVGDVTPEKSVGKQAGVYLWSEGKVMAIVRPGDALPGGGTVLTASLVPGNLDLNAAGDVAFTVTMRSESNGAYDTGLGLMHDGHLSMLVRSGAEIASIGRVLRVHSSLMHDYNATGGAKLNAAGDVAFSVVLQDRSVAILVASQSKGSDAGNAVEALPMQLTINANTVLRGGSAVRFALPHSGDMALRLFSVDGRRVATLAQGSMPAGRHEATLDATRIAPGVYFLRLQSGSETVSHKFTLMH